jgi:hypothetical protein
LRKHWGAAGSCLAGIALAMAAKQEPLRATRSESVFSKILFHFHILHNKKGVSPSPLKLGINMLPPAYNSIRAKMLCSNAQKLEAGMQTKRKIRRCGAWVTGFIITVLFCAGCSVEQTNRTKISDLDYTIVAENEIPEELLADIEEALKTILAGIDNVKNGISMCIFPEGTRNKTDDLMLPFKEGSFKIAEKSGCPIIPMAITNSADVLEAHMPRVKKTHVIVEYGTPIYPNELDKEQKKKIGAYCQNVIAEMLEKNKDMIA